MTKTFKTKWLALGVVVTAAVLVAGCDTLMGNREHHRASNLYSYLYSGQKEHVDTPAVPVLSLPLRVGIAFVPAGGDGKNNYPYAEDSNFSESQKIELMKQISAQFKQYPFVKSIELIPSAYLTPKGGFANLDQIRTMYDVDVMTLLSYDQAQFTDEGVLSLSYWTIVGLYVVPGEKNDTQTMMDAAVYDIASRKLLFRAPGIGNIKGSATPVNLAEELRGNSKAGFEKAATNLVANLRVELADFKEQVTNAPTEYKVEFKPGYTGGAFGGVETVIVGGLGACFLWTRRTRKAA
ncbi:MAG TPA: rhombotarget lipoprotein [Candidatus Acidoferrales bacterium]|jgi:rhombotail lipoprotein|nr:rhombotarget lipoprotein [Candidatus Acidoferrales bacterium]